MRSRRQQLGRNTGIDLLGNVPWGAHLCLFYETQEDLIDILVPYFKAGLENNELCMWVTAEPCIGKKAEKAMRDAIPDFDRYLRKEQIRIVPDSEWYLKDNIFNVQRVLNAWTDQLNQALSSGFAGMRVTGDMSGFGKKVWREVADYEKEVNNVIDKYRMLALCSYCIDECGAPEIINVVSCHRSAMIRREGKWEVIESGDCKKAEEEIKNLAKFPEENSNPVYRASRDGVLLYANPAGRRLIFGDQIKTGDKIPEKWIGMIRNVYGSGKKQQAEIEISGRVFLFDIVPIIEDGYVNLYATDITERKQAAEALRTSEIKYKALLEDLPEKVFLKDSNLVYVSCNENYAKDFKIKAEEIVGKTDNDLYPGQLAEKYKADDRRIIESGKTEDVNEKRIQNGREIIVHTVKSPVRDKEGNVKGILGILLDVTAQRQSQKKLLVYQKQLRDLASEMSLTEEHERRRIAVELHDHVMQDLILFKISSGQLRGGGGITGRIS